MAVKPGNVATSLAFVIFGGPGILGVYLPGFITGWRMPEDMWNWRLVGLVPMAIGLAPLFESIVRFVRVGGGTLLPTHPTDKLVVSGFYRHVRNPMYVGMLAWISGLCVLYRSWGLCAYLAAVAAGFHLFVMTYEEPTLGRKYGPAYEEFRRRVPRWIPRLTPWEASQE